jgi:hypothetical protein
VFAFVAASIAHFISFEISRGSGMLWSRSLAALRHWAFVAVIGMEVIIHMTAKVGGTMKPGSGTDEDAAGKPFRAVVSVRSAAIGRCVVVAIGALRSYADIDADLSLCLGSTCCEAQTCDCQLLQEI